MNFEDEPYVRLYTRKTLTWKLLGWEGRAVRNAMLDGEFDAAGIFEFRGDPAASISAVTDLPLEIVRIGLQRLIDTETWVVTDRVITWQSYEEAQNCRRSDRLRQRESRRARSAQSVTGVTLRSDARHSPSQRVTASHPPSLCLPPSAPILPPTQRDPERAVDVPDVPGLERVGSARTYEMPGPDPTPSYLAACVMAGVRPEQARDTWVYYATKGLPPGDYPNLEGWLVLMAKQRQTSASKAPARASPGSDLDTTGAATAFKPNPDHERFARSALPKHDLGLLAQKCRAVPRFARLSTAEQDREFAARLRHLKATGMFFADGPIPKARVQKEANP